MNKLDEFKEFIKDKDYLINKVHNKEVSWQTLYETYDLYGKEHDLFKNNLKQNNTLLSKEGINNAINAFKDIDLEKVSTSLESIKKVVNTIQEITKVDSKEVDIPEYMKKSTFRRYND